MKPPESMPTPELYIQPPMPRQTPEMKQLPPLEPPKQESVIPVPPKHRIN